MKHLVGQGVFAVGRADYRWEDVLLAAEAWGDWSSVAERTRQGLACLERTGDKEGRTPSENDLEAAATEFRYARDLLTAEEAEAWLSRWGMTVGSWMRAIAADLRLREQALAPVEGGTAKELEEPDDFEDALLAEAVCSGALERLAYRLAGRAAVFEKLHHDAEPTDEDGDRARLVARLEASFQDFRASVLTPAALVAHVRARRADWTRLHCRVLRLPTEEMAREALLSVRDDGLTLDEVAADARAEASENLFFLEEADPAVGARLMAARPGDLVGPIQTGRAFTFYSILERVPPSVADEVIVRRAEESLLSTLVTREIDDRVKWRWKL